MSFGLVQGSNHQNGGTSSSTVAVTLTSVISSGSAVLVAVGINNGGSIDNITVTDNKSNTYTPVDSAANSSGGYSWFTFYSLNITNGPQTVTATDHSASRQFATIIAEEWSGIATTSALDGHNINSQNSPGTGSNAVVSGTYTTTANGDLVWGATVSVNGLNPGVGTGFTVGSQNDASSSFTTEYLTQATASASTQATFTIGTSGTDFTLTASMAFKALPPAVIARPNRRIIPVTRTRFT